METILPSGKSCMFTVSVEIINNFLYYLHNAHACRYTAPHIAEGGISMSVQGVQAEQQNDRDNFINETNEPAMENPGYEETNESVIENPGSEEIVVVKTYLRIHTRTQHTCLNEPTETSLGQTQPTGSAVDGDSPSDEPPHLVYTFTNVPPIWRQESGEQLQSQNYEFN